MKIVLANRDGKWEADDYFLSDYQVAQSISDQNVSRVRESRERQEVVEKCGVAGDKSLPSPTICFIFFE